MAVELLTFPSASAQIHKLAGDGEMELVSNILEYARGISDQCQTILLRSDVNQNGEDFHSEVDRVLKILLLESQIAEVSASSQNQTQIIKDSMASLPQESTRDVACMEFSRNDQSERFVLPVVTCGEGDGGHKCPYFPCPECHRSRSIFVPESNLNVRSRNDNSKSDRHTLMRCEEDEVISQETPLVIRSNADDRDVFGVNDQTVPVVTCGEGDGGHRCPYFPCPYCHRSRSISVPQTDYNVRSPSSIVTRIDDQSVGPVVTCPDGGHKCPYFPCPTCHRTR